MFDALVGDEVIAGSGVGSYGLHVDWNWGVGLVLENVTAAYLIAFSRRPGNSN